MRLNTVELSGIIQAITPFVAPHRAELRLYGSRTDDTKKGGDIDLMLVVSSTAVVPLKENKDRIVSAIKKQIGDRKIDLLICDEIILSTDPFLAIVYPDSLLLKQWKG